MPPGAMGGPMPRGPPGPGGVPPPGMMGPGMQRPQPGMPPPTVRGAGAVDDRATILCGCLCLANLWQHAVGEYADYWTSPVCGCL